MLKREMVWRHLADEVLEGRRTTFHQTQLATELGMSIGNVNLALEPLRSIGAVSVEGKTLVIRDVKKVVLLWGARRDPLRPIAAFESFEGARTTLKILPPGLALTSFAGFVSRYRQEPAPFSTIRGYARPGDQRAIDELGRRFSRTTDLSQATVLVHEADPILARRLPHVVGPAQLYVDLWSEPDFFSSDYLRALEGSLRL